MINSWNNLIWEWSNVGLMLAHRLRRWANIKPTFGVYFFTDIVVFVRLKLVDQYKSCVTPVLLSCRVLAHLSTEYWLTPAIVTSLSEPDQIVTDGRLRWRRRLTIANPPRRRLPRTHCTRHSPDLLTPTLYEVITPVMANRENNFERNVRYSKDSYTAEGEAMIGEEPHGMIEQGGKHVEIRVAENRSDRIPRMSERLRDKRVTDLRKRPGSQHSERTPSEYSDTGKCSDRGIIYTDR